MSIEAHGVVENGSIHLDEVLPLPDQTRVRLLVEPVAETNSSSAAWERVKKRLQHRPIHGGGLRYSREDLHERR